MGWETALLGLLLSEMATPYNERSKRKNFCTSYNHWNSCRIIICISLMAILHAREKKKDFDKDIDLLDSAPLWHLAPILWQASHRDRKVQVSPQASLAQGRFEILHSKAIFILEEIMASEFYPTQRLFLSYYSLGLCFFTWFLQWALGQGKEEKCTHWFLPLHYPGGTWGLRGSEWGGPRCIQLPHPLACILSSGYCEVLVGYPSPVHGYWG